jgi:hypothetical protein
MPDPRKIALAKNGGGGFGDDAPGYDYEDGVPSGQPKRGTPQDVSANPVNPAPKPAPIRVKKSG